MSENRLLYKPGEIPPNPEAPQLDAERAARIHKLMPLLDRRQTALNDWLLLAADNREPVSKTVLLMVQADLNAVINVMIGEDIGVDDLMEIDNGRRY